MRTPLRQVGERVCERVCERNFTLFSKIVVAFLLVVIPISAIGLLVNLSGEKIVRDELLQSHATNVHFYLQSLETEIARIMRVEQEYLVKDDDFRKAGTMPETMSDYERSQVIRRIMSKLSILKSSSPYVKEISIYFPKLGRTIWANRLGEETPHGESGEVTRSARSSGSPLNHRNNELSLSIAYPTSGVGMSFALKVELSLPLLEKALAQLSNFATSQSILLHEQEGWAIRAKPEDDTLAQIRQFLAHPSNADVLSGQERLVINKHAYLLYFERSPSLGVTLIHYVAEKEALAILNQYRTSHWMLIGVSFIVVVLFSYGIFLLVDRPLKRLVRALRQVGKGNLAFRLQQKYRDEFYDVFKQFNTMASQIQTLIDEVSEQKTRSQRSELKQLQSQINPHFLYNSLFILLTLIRQGEMKSAEQLVLHMGTFFRLITRNGEDEVALEKEFLFANAYIGIQSIRFPHIDVRCSELPVSLLKFKVPRLIVQPIIENAYVHGLEGKDGDGMLLIDVWAADGCVTVCVADNGDQLDEATLQRLKEALVARADQSTSRASTDVAETTGLLNVHRRLQLKYGNAYGIQLSRGELGGLEVLMRFPLCQGDNHV